MYVNRPQIMQVVQAQSVADQWQEQTSGLAVRLKRTQEPVWPEDEAAELAQPGASPVPPLGNDEADAALRAISVKLPDRLIPIGVDPGHLGSFTGTLLVPPGIPWAYPKSMPGYDHVAFNVPTSFAAPDRIVLRRIRLDLTFSSDGDGGSDPSGTAPIVVYLKPEPDVAVDVHKVGEFGIDLGQILTTVVPHLPGVFTARVGGSIERTDIHAKVQVDGGVGHHECSWRVSDARIAYGFNPSVIALLAASRNLWISARLHVEVREQVLGLFHKTYGKSADPMMYEYRRGEPLMTAFSYFARMKELGHEQDLYRDNIAGSEAMHRLGDLTREHDPAEAEAWYRRAADAGDVDAMVKLGKMVADPQEAARWQERAAAAGGTRVMLRLGDEADDRAQAEVWYRRAAGAGDVDAMLKLGQLAGNREEALRWNEQAAAAGGGETMLRLGDQAQTRDRTEAEGWYRRAADVGNVDAMVRLGRLLEDWDRREAARWYRRAAASGSQAGRQYLKRLYPVRHLFMRRR
jgi:TPR repeat protein